MSMTDHDSANEMFLERCQEEVDQFLAKFDWKSAQGIIDDMRARGFDHHADILRKVLLEAQFAWSENPRYEPVEEVDILPLTPEEDDAPEYVPSLPEHELEKRERALTSMDNPETRVSR